MNQEEYLLVLKKTTKILNSIGVKWFFMSGTLLSIMRKEYIDGDVDVGIMTPIPREELLRYFFADGFCYVHGFGNLKTGAQDTVRFGTITVDLHRIYFLQDILCHCAWDGEQTGWAECEMVQYDFKGFEPIEITLKVIEEKIFIPSAPTLYLRQHFGDNWKTPIKVWHFAKSCPNAWYTGIILPKINEFKEWDKNENRDVHWCL